MKFVYASAQIGLQALALIVFDFNSKLVVSSTELTAIQTISLPIFKRKDRLVWHFNSDGAYSVKSGYHLATQLKSSAAMAKPESPFYPS